MIRYLLKIHMAKHYGDLALTLKTLYAPLAERLARWSTQDEHIAEEIYQYALDDGDIDDVDGLVSFPAFLTDYEPEGDPDNPDVLAILQGILTDAIYAENLVQNVMQDKYELYARISRQRVITLESMQ